MAVANHLEVAHLAVEVVGEDQGKGVVVEVEEEAVVEVEVEEKEIGVVLIQVVEILISLGENNVIGVMKINRKVMMAMMV